MAEGIHILPHPAKVEPAAGEFRLRPTSRILWQDPEAEPLAHLLAEYLRPASGFALPVRSADDTGETDIALDLTGADAKPDAHGFVTEAYECVVEPGSVRLESATPAGLARAIQTLRQLFPAAIFAPGVQGGPWRVPAVRISDAPRFRWRGLHLDVSRSFFTLEEVCRYIELAALHRFNICHLHLTDDQGWRVEIRSHPRLTEVGSRRAQTLVGHDGDRPRRYDGQEHGGFYTHEEIRELVTFAARRHIQLVPEIDMPGHAQAAVAAYPELGNASSPLATRCHWGISRHILNVEESTIAFMHDVLNEVMNLFPGRFIHVGGDEAPKKEWSESPAAQARLAELGLANEHELQSWFIGRMAGAITARRRQMIGWDEIMEGGLCEGAVVMSWRGEAGGIEAARLGHDVVMAPDNRVYFDHYQAEPVAGEPLAICEHVCTTESVYAYEPIPAELPADRHHHVLGAQGQLWTEYIRTASHLDYMAYPRACALAETLWLAPEAKDYAGFLQRLATHRERFRHLDVNAHPQP